jgi:hypothetical protein
VVHQALLADPPQKHVRELRVMQRVIAGHAAMASDNGAGEFSRKIAPVPDHHLEPGRAAGQRCLDDQVP